MEPSSGWLHCWEDRSSTCCFSPTFLVLKRPWKSSWWRGYSLETGRQQCKHLNMSILKHWTVQDEEEPIAENVNTPTELCFFVSPCVLMRQKGRKKKTFNSSFDAAKFTLHLRYFPVQVPAFGSSDLHRCTMTKVVLVSFFFFFSFQPLEFSQQLV